MQNHLEILDSLSEKLDDLTEQINNLNEIIKAERIRLATLLAQGSTDSEDDSSVSVPLPLSDKNEEIKTPIFALPNLALPDDAGTIDDFVPVESPVELETKSIQETKSSLPPYKQKEDNESPKLEDFEPSLSFSLIKNISLADTFFYANELFFGNQALLIDMLGEMEHFSSISQVEQYLYSVRGFSRESDTIQRLLSFVVANASTRS